jgi:hypothetical protein
VTPQARIALAMDPECTRTNLMKVCFAKTKPSIYNRIVSFFAGNDRECDKIINSCKKKNIDLVKMYNSCFTTFTCFGGSIF